MQFSKRLQHWLFVSLFRCTCWTEGKSYTICLTHSGRDTHILVEIMDCRLFGAKSYLNQWWNIVYWNLDQINTFSFTKCIWKCRLRNDGHLVSCVLKSWVNIHKWMVSIYGWEIWDGMFIVIMSITPLIQDSSLCVYAVNLPPLIPCTTRLCETVQEEPISVTRHRAWSTHWLIWFSKYINIQPWDVTIHSCPNEVRHGWLMISHWKLLVWLLTSTLSNLSIAKLVMSPRMSDDRCFSLCFLLP